MWEKYHFILRQYQQQYDTRQYCLKFLELIGQRTVLWDSSCLESILLTDTHHQGAELFPQSSHCFERFNQGDYEFVINFIYHFAGMEHDWLYDKQSFEDLSSEQLLVELFNAQGNMFLFKNINFKPEILLSQDSLPRLYTFLFLFFLPCIKPDEMLWHHQQKIPLICCSEITNDFFDMLLALMQEFQGQVLEDLCQGHNLNHLLVENLIGQNIELYVCSDNDQWQEALPLYKIRILLEMGCNFDFFSRYFKDGYQVLFENVPKVMLDIQRRYAYQKMDARLAQKHKAKKNTLKI